MKSHLPQFREVHWLGLILILWLWLIGPGAIEGRLFPAAKPMVIDRLEQVDKGTAIWGESARLRAECSFRKVKWYLGNRNGKNVPARVDTGPPVVRQEGAFTFGPWVVDIWPPDVVRVYSYADVYHRCRLAGVEMPWLTKSRFWN